MPLRICDDPFQAVTELLGLDFFGVGRTDDRQRVRRRDPPLHLVDLPEELERPALVGGPFSEAL